MNQLDILIGKKILEIWISTTYLKFVTDQGEFIYEVTGDCCSHSYFYDFIGVEKLLKNGPVKSVRQIELKEGDYNFVPCAPEDRGEEDGYDYIDCYGYEIVTESPEFGDMTAVFSFRNDSNGYYGGSISLVFPKTEYTYYNSRHPDDIGDLVRLTGDITEVK